MRRARAKRLICQYVVEHDPADIVNLKIWLDAYQAQISYTIAFEKKKEQYLEAEKSSTRKKRSEGLAD